MSSAYTDVLSLPRKRPPSLRLPGREMCPLGDTKLTQTYWNPLIASPDFHASLMKDILTSLRAAIPRDGRYPRAGADFASDLWASNIQADPFVCYQALAEVLRDQASENAVSELAKQMFEFQQTRVWTCQRCGHFNRAQETKEIGIDISIDVPSKGLELTSYLAQTYFEDLEAQTYTCDNHDCQAMETTKSHTKIVAAPSMLVLRLKRFVNEVDTRGFPIITSNQETVNIKLREEVKFSEFLDLSAYTIDDDSVVYRLDRIIYHAGARVNSGHYIAAVRDRDYQTRSVIDDAQVRTSGAVAHVGTVRGFDPYILVYSKL